MDVQMYMYNEWTYNLERKRKAEIHPKKKSTVNSADGGNVEEGDASDPDWLNYRLVPYIIKRK